MGEISKIDWNESKTLCDLMYDGNQYQTPYQSWEFLNYVGKGFQLKKPFDGMFYKLQTFVYSNTKGKRCILPLEINSFKKQIRMRGFCSSIGHLDFIYPKDFEKEEYDEMMYLLAEMYKGYTFIFDRISEKSLTYRFNLERKKETSECILIPIVDDWEVWFQNSTGSKTRKNMRRAYRNIENDGYKISLKVFNSNNKIDINTWNGICNLFAIRSCVHNGLDPKFFSGLVKVIKANDPIAKALYNSKYSMITTMFFNDDLVAFGCGVKSNDGRFISMRHGINMKYKDYQIGLIYTSEVIKEFINNKNIYQVNAFDRSRGAEQHKIGVGGKLHLNYGWNQRL